MNNNNNTEKYILQSKESNLEFNTPIIFNKKINKSVIKTLQYINNDTGITKHYPPAAQEWFNSVYAYNKNYTKLLPIADKNLMNLLKSYFNIFVNNKVLKTKRLANRYRRLSANKIFIGKGDLKHTSNKVIVTFYVYNTEKLFLLNQINKMFKSLFFPGKILQKYVTLDRNGKQIITYNRPFTLKEFLQLPDHYGLYYSHLTLLINKLSNYFTLLLKYYEYLTKLVETKVLNNDEKFLIFKNKLKSVSTFKYPNFNDYMILVKENYIKKLNRFRYLLKINNAKFERPFIWELTRLVKNVYNKEVEFNIVNLQKMHLNSDIFTQTVSLKLRNRDNKLFRVLRSSLSKIKLSNVSRISEKYSKPNRDEYLINKIRNSYISSSFNNSITRIDPLNKLLLDFFPSAENLEIEIKKRSSSIKSPISLKSFIIKSLKHLNLAGVRVEAKGRLTRRFTASRSVFKMKWKGGLKNVDSSFKGLSAVMLRGNVKSNVQYSTLNTKNRNGAFGVKGWVSNK